MIYVSWRVKGKGSILMYILEVRVWRNSMYKISMYELLIHLKGGGAYLSNVLWCWYKIHFPTIQDMAKYDTYEYVWCVMIMVRLFMSSVWELHSHMNMNFK